MENKTKLKIEEVLVSTLKPADYNPRKWTEPARKALSKSLDEFGFVQPIVVNSAPERYGVIIGGNFKLDIAKKRGYETVPVVFVNLPDIEKEKELNLRLNKNQGDFDFQLLSSFEEEMLLNVGFDEGDMQMIFKDDDEIAVYKNVISFTVTENQHALIKSALDLAKDHDGIVETGKRGPRNSDYLTLIIQEWLDAQ